MKNISLILCAFLALAITSCNKHGNSKVRIKKMTSNRGFSTEYAYGTDGNITYSKTSDGAKTTYKFSGNTISEQLTDSAKGMSISSTIYLSSHGWVDSTTAMDEGSPYLKTYTHDGEGFIVESRDYVAGALVNMSKSAVVDGNQQSVTVSDSAKPLFSVYFDYYTDKTNVLSYENYGMGFLGADSKNLIKRFVQVLPTGDTIRRTTFKYYFDGDGKVTSKAMYDDTRHMMVDSTVFTYN